MIIVVVEMEIEVFDLLNKVDELGLDGADDVCALFEEIIWYVRENAYEGRTIETDLWLRDKLLGVNAKQSEELQSVIRSAGRDVPPESLFKDMLAALQ